MSDYLKKRKEWEKKYAEYEKNKRIKEARELVGGLHKKADKKFADVLLGGGGLAPYVGDIMDIDQILSDLKNKDYSNAAIGGLLLMLPNAIEKLGRFAKPYVKKVVKGLIDKGVPLNKIEESVGSIEKKWGLSFEELNTSSITTKDLAEKAPESLGPTMGYYNQTGQVNYDNNMQLRKFKKPNGNQDDIFLAYDPETEGTIAYKRKYINDPTSKEFIGKKPSDIFTIKMDMPKTSHEKIKQSMEELQKVLPPKHFIEENDNISTDGLRAWNKQLQYGYNPTGEVFTTKVSNAGKDDLFKGLNKADNEIDFKEVTFNDDENLDEGTKRLSEFLDKNGLSYNIQKTKNKKIDVTLPKLQRGFSRGGIV